VPGIGMTANNLAASRELEALGGGFPGFELEFHLLCFRQKTLRENTITEAATATVTRQLYAEDFTLQAFPLDSQVYRAWVMPAPARCR
jgi:hypothetical protein